MAGEPPETLHELADAESDLANVEPSPKICSTWNKGSLIITEDLIILGSNHYGQSSAREPDLPDDQWSGGGPAFDLST